MNTGEGGRCYELAMATRRISVWRFVELLRNFALRGRYVEPKYPLFCPLTGDFTDRPPVGIMIARYTEEPYQTIDGTAVLAGAIMLRDSSSGANTAVQH
jgi:hypothetical protein